MTRFTIRAIAGLALREQDGQTVTEYAVVMAVVLLITVAGVTGIGTEALEVLRHVANALQ